jgi:hypothetical protein
MFTKQFALLTVSCWITAAQQDIPIIPFSAVRTSVQAFSGGGTITLPAIRVGLQISASNGKSRGRSERIL